MQPPGMVLLNDEPEPAHRKLSRVNRHSRGIVL
jgi:hypothetical protein